MSGDSGRTAHSVGEILRGWGPEYSRTHAMTHQQRRVMQRLGACRTAALGGHMEKCDQCGHERPAYDSCGDRHCPTCQGKLAREWLAERLEDVLNTPYFHCIFTIPEQFNPLVAYNQRAIYEILFRAAVRTLRSFARQRLGVELGIVAVLHTWGQALWLHPHIHCIVTGGGLSFDRARWVSTGPDFLFDVFELSRDFRRRFCRLLRQAKLRFEGEAACLADAAAFHALLDAQEKRDWVVHSKKPVRGPRQVLEYISRYTHRVGGYYYTMLPGERFVGERLDISSMLDGPGSFRVSATYEQDGTSINAPFTGIEVKEKTGQPAAGADGTPRAQP